MHIDPETIPNPDLQMFLRLLRRNNMDSIVVLGGAVRDTLVQRPCKDIDIAVRLPLRAPANVCTPSLNAPYEILPILSAQLAPLADLLGYSIDDFRVVEDGLPFGRTHLDLLGMVSVVDASGRQYPDIFIDHCGETFGAYCELTVNRIAIDGTGRLWPELYVSHLHNAVATFTQSPLGLDLYRMLRALRTCKDLGLRFESTALKLITTHLNTLLDADRLSREMSERRIQSILHEVLDDQMILCASTDPRTILASLETVLSRYA